MTRFVSSSCLCAARRVFPLGLLLLGVGGCDDFRPQFVETLDLDPDSVFLSPGESATFGATAFDDRGEALPERSNRIEYDVRNDPAITAEVNEGVLTVTGLEVGTGRFTASLGRAEIQGRAHVQPPGLARIEIEGGGAPISLPVGSRPDLEAFLFDAAGNRLDPEGFRISWAVGDSRMIFVGQANGPVTNLFLRQRGTTNLRLIVGGQSTSITINIT